MARRVTVNVGFITNSSSCVYYFPLEVLNDPEVKAFIEAHELEDGYIGEDLWYRSACSSFLVTKDQKAEAKRLLRSYDADSGPEPEEESKASKVIDPDSEGVYVIYGDEYNSTTQLLCSILSKALAKIDPPKSYFRAGYLTDYN